MASMLLVSIVVFFLYVFQPLETDINVLLIYMDAEPLYKTNNRYLSVALDASLIANNFEGFDLENPKLQQMMTPLGGSYLRIGGKLADRLNYVPHTIMQNTHIIYEMDGGICAYEEGDCITKHLPNYTLSARAWIQLNWLAKRTNFTILFDLNSLHRYETGEWDSKNAEKLIGFSNKHGFDLIWELGNEPNSYRHVFNYDVSGQQLAKDFKKLRQILNDYPKYYSSLLVGPDITRPKHYTSEPTQFLTDFLSNMDSDVINAITWHQYYFKGSSARLCDFIDPDIFNLLENEILAIKSVTRETHFEDTPIWLGETSSAYGGGSPVYSNKFAATFIWLDKLGLAAKNGINLIVRQSLFKGFYALLDENYNPNPDWWISVLYKKLIGPEVLDCMMISNSGVRFYCHCASKFNGYLNTSTIAVYGSNIDNKPATIRLEEANSDVQEAKYTIMEFRIETQISLVSKDLYLNNVFLQMQADGQLPIFKPKIYSSNIIIIPPYALGFWLIQNPKIEDTCCK